MQSNHHHGSVNYDLAFGVGVALNVAYILAEAGLGWFVNSLALLADAGHNLSDVLGLLLAWGAYYLGGFEPTARRTYGWRSSTILAAMFNALILLMAIGGIAWEAIRRLSEPQEVAGGTLMAVAGFGVVVNTATALLFLRGRKVDLNLRGAFLHMAADAAVSFGVVLSGLAILLTGWYWLDPTVSLLIAVVIFVSTWGLLRDSLNLALHAVPAGIDTIAVREFLGGLPGVDEVHDLHIWAMSTTETALTAHLVKPDGNDNDRLLADAGRELHDRFGIEHVTLQVERSEAAIACKQAPCGRL